MVVCGVIGAGVQSAAAAAAAGAGGGGAAGWTVVVERDAAGEHECRQRVEVSQDDDCMGQFRQRPTVTATSHALQQVQ